MPEEIDFAAMACFEKVEVEFKEKRDRIVHELLETEQGYVRDLFVLRDVYKKSFIRAIEESLLPMAVEDVNVIFGNIEIIIAVNEALLNDLIGLMQNWASNPCVGSAITPFVFGFVLAYFRFICLKIIIRILLIIMMRWIC